MLFLRFCRKRQRLLNIVSKNVINSFFYLCVVQLYKISKEDFVNDTSTQNGQEAVVKKKKKNERKHTGRHSSQLSIKWTPVLISEIIEEINSSENNHSGVLLLFGETQISTHFLQDSNNLQLKLSTTLLKFVLCHTLKWRVVLSHIDDFQTWIKVSFKGFIKF